MSPTLLLWYLGFQLLALAALPLAARVFRALPDRGYAFSKILGWLLVSYLVWVTGMLGMTEFSRATIVVAAVGLAAFSWWRWHDEIREAWVERRHWVVLEAVFTSGLIVAALIRAYTPEIHGQEKFMDYAIMNSFLTHRDLPAPDPWLAGYGMPYYHFGYYAHALLAKLSSAPGPSAYNLSVALVFALTAAAAFSLVSNVVRLSSPTSRLGASMAGSVAAILIVAAGNLEAILEVLAVRGVGSADFWATMSIKNLQPGSAAATGWLPTDGGWWWRASRVVPTTKPDGINEFPYFSFLLGDLHPHYMALPLEMLVVALAVVALIRPVTRIASARLVVSALALGLIVPLNTWDVPVFWGLFGAMSLIGIWRSEAGRRGIGPLVVTYVCAIALIVPYFIGYTSQPLSPALVDERTPLPSLLIIFGSFILVAATWLLLAPSPPAFSTGSPRWLTIALAAGMIGAALAALTGLRSLAVALVLASLAWYRLGQHALNRDEPTAGRLTEMVGTTLVALGFLIVAGTELVFVKDSFGTRMNTVFKFHYNAWLLLGLGSALALAALAAKPGVRRVVSVLIGAVVLMAGAVYPVAATYTKTGELRNQPTLDGTSGLRRIYPNDFAAIDWLNGSVGERDTIVEAVGGDYEDYARVSTFSGLPTPIGWIGHELQWRGSSDVYTQRERLVRSVYTAPDAEALRVAMRALEARYVFIGRLEREKYGPEVADRLRAWLPAIHQHGDTIILGLPAGSPR